MLSFSIFQGSEAKKNRKKPLLIKKVQLSTIGSTSFEKKAANMQYNKIFMCKNRELSYLK